MYAMQSNPKYDLSALGSFCYSGLMIMMLSSVLRLLGFPLSDVVMSALGSLCFSGFIVYDTRRICDGTHPEHTLSSKQYVMGALALYMDIINLFVYLLRLFGEREK